VCDDESLRPYRTVCVSFAAAEDAAHGAMASNSSTVLRKRWER